MASKRTAAQTSASRANGAKGGRPRKLRYVDEFEELGPPPKHPLKLARWCQRALAIDMWRHMSNTADPELSQQIRATVTAIGRIMPADITAEAERLIREDNQQLRVTEDVDLEELSAKEQCLSSISCAPPRS